MNTFQERITRVDNAIESIVRFLGSRIAEGKLAVALLLELSKSELVRDCIGKVQGCLLLLVAKSRSDESEVAGDARELLENLSFSNENVIQMAKANYFKHLLQHLSSGSFLKSGVVPSNNIMIFSVYYFGFLLIETLLKTFER